MPPRRRLPFLLKRPILLLRDLLMDRDRPALERLAHLEDPETFLWAILPHAARTFAACITVLPEVLARSTAVAYLYCRMLDTCEDLIPDPEERDASLEWLGAHLRGGAGKAGPPPNLDTSLAQDPRDATHILLVNRRELIDRVLVELPEPVQGFIADLVEEMAAGMRWSARTFNQQGGVLMDEEQLSRYCYGVLGTTMVFAARAFRWHLGEEGSLSPEDRSLAIDVGEFLQLANITRDIEKDLLRGVAYHPLLARDLGRNAAEDPALRQRVRRVRVDLLQRALRLAPAFRRLVQTLPLRTVSLHRASASLMLLFTERYYLGCAERCGGRTGIRRRSSAGILMAALPAWLSPSAGRRILERSERNLAAISLPPAIE